MESIFFVYHMDRVIQVYHIPTRWIFNSGSRELHNESLHNQSELFIQFFPLGSVRKAETYQVGSKKKWWKCLLVLEKEWGDPSLSLPPWLLSISGSICNPASIHPQGLHAGSKWSFWQCNLAYWNLILCVCVGGGDPGINPSPDACEYWATHSAHVYHFPRHWGNKMRLNLLCRIVSENVNSKLKYKGIISYFCRVKFHG